MKITTSICVLILAASLMASFAHSQEKTEIEEFSAETGSVKIMGYTDVKKMSALGGSISFQKRIIGSPDNPEALKGMLINVTTSRSTGKAFIDEKEIDDLLRGIKYISLTTKEVTQLENFEVSYTTVGGFKITVFNDSSGKLSAAVKSGSYSVYPNFSDLPAIVSAIELSRP
jgi:hypothetical protein